MTSKQLTFIDMTTFHNHESIKNRAIGASEHQCYNLIEILSHTYTITCYNSNKNPVKLDNILNYELTMRTIIIFFYCIPIF